MKKQRTPILLILMMLITPIVSAFDHCTGMEMSNHLLEKQMDSMSAMGESFSADKAIMKESPGNEVDMDCHGSNSCTLHAYGIISTSSPINTKISLYYSDFKYTSLHSNISPSILRPPIATL